MTDDELAFWQMVYVESMRIWIQFADRYGTVSAYAESCANEAILARRLAKSSESA